MSTQWPGWKNVDFYVAQTPFTLPATPKRMLCNLKAFTLWQREIDPFRTILSLLPDIYDHVGWSWVVSFWWPVLAFPTTDRNNSLYIDVLGDGWQGRPKEENGQGSLGAVQGCGAGQKEIDLHTRFNSPWSVAETKEAGMKSRVNGKSAILASLSNVYIGHHNHNPFP